ncbi:peptidase S8 and S53 subtilisin kexin sedolisin [Ferrimonas balearica DSM 9799]|uniref:Peptidase S8 and S53 subtilisin kexin sedolisin n=1 Tax=Ferrimonas balearica (strain DSM 9799 / CCM 4581 / KCTC 23876 / PAT) TaxID=550540 RepID=E1SRB1_FERBD|nr:S8 family serine peptidase [Ferrimonas balearica]ADN74876.1 peptidase S8 and S53 subtilisin kexin sedolisin [Ferrimonas balearica DSM 9799]
MSKTKIAFSITFAVWCCSFFAWGEQPINTYAHFEQLATRTHWEPPLRTEIPNQKQQRFIVQFQSAPLISLGVRGSAATWQTSQTQNTDHWDRVWQHQEQLNTEYRALSDALNTEGINAGIAHRFSTVMNGVVLSGSNLNASEIAAIPVVKAVFPERYYSVSLDASQDLINAPVLWERLGQPNHAGKGVKIAIIDSGIYPEHPMFSDEGFQPASQHRPQDDYCATVDSTFCNNKVIAARWISPTFPVWQDEYMSPRGFNGHGTHVAGIAAGNPVTTEFKGQQLDFSGVAPGAYLMVYKALYASANNPNGASGSNIMLLQALEHAVNDGADVINNSWGGAVGMDPALSPFQDAIEAAEAAGIVVVNSAGNSGPSANTIGCPGCIEAGITVANSSHGRFISHFLKPDGFDPMVAAPALTNLTEREIRAPIATINQLSNIEGCEPFSANSLQGQIVLLQRGTCGFIVKAQNAHAAGAVAMLVFNDRPGEPITMAMHSSPIPAAMISQFDGAALLSIANNGASVMASLSDQELRLVAKAFADHISPSSSRGPNGDPHILKPDITAPGTNILSAIPTQQANGKTSSYAMLSGTSMAAPHVAGAAALMRQLHPDWSAIEIKTALTSSSHRDNLRKEDNNSAATPFDVGAGRLDLDAAARAVLTFDKASYTNPNCVTQCQFNVVATNRGNREASWEVSAQLPNAEVVITPARVLLAPGVAQEITVKFNSLHMETDRWHFGELTFSGSSDAHLPLAILHTLSSNRGMTALYGDKSSLGYGEQSDYHARFTNNSFHEEIDIKLQVSQSLTFDHDSIRIRSNSSSGGQLNIDHELNAVRWTGLLDTQFIAIKQTHVPGIATQAHQTNRVPCPDGCDEASLVYRARVPFKFNGDDYEVITLSSNGFLVIGETQINSGWRNQKLPDIDTPNGVIAPFWTDLNLLGDEEAYSSTSGNGSMHLYEVLGDDNEPLWLVVDWIDVQAYGASSAQQYSFGVWLGTGPNKGTNLMTYYQLGPLPSQLTVGVEDSEGNNGAVRYFNGQGFEPKAGETLKVDTQPAGHVDIDLVLANQAAEFKTNQQFQAQEDVPLRIDLLELHSQLKHVPIILAAKHQGVQVQAMQLIDLIYPEIHDIALVRQPEHGTAQMNAEHLLLYQPNRDYYGADSLQYRLLDSDGTTWGFVDINIEIANVNDRPIIDPIAEQSASPGQTVEILLSAEDADNDVLNWGATQRSGTSAHYTLNDNKLVITLAEGAKEETLTFTVVASDGVVESEPVTASINVVSGTSPGTPPQKQTEEAAEKGGGSLTIGLWLLPVLMAFRRRRAYR